MVFMVGLGGGDLRRGGIIDAVGGWGSRWLTDAGVRGCAEMANGKKVQSTLTCLAWYWTYADESARQTFPTLAKMLPLLSLAVGSAGASFAPGAPRYWPQFSGARDVTILDGESWVPPPPPHPPGPPAQKHALQPPALTHWASARCGSVPGFVPGQWDYGYVPFEDHFDSMNPAFTPKVNTWRQNRTWCFCVTKWSFFSRGEGAACCHCHCLRADVC